MQQHHMKKTLLVLMVLMLSVAGNGFAQKNAFNKITPDLQEEMSLNAKGMFDIIIIMDEQFDAQKSSRQLQQLGKEAQRTFVVEELQQIAQRGQKSVLTDLQQGQKSSLVANIKSFWIINAVSCSMTKDMVWAIADRPDVKYVMKSLTIHLIDGEDSEEVILNRANNQWNVTKVNANQVWAMGYTGTGVIVAVIDTGVNYNHTDIANNMWEGGSAYPHHGWDFVNNDNDPMDDKGHGTHCAGTVSSYGTNNKQCGIAKDATIMSLKVLNSNGQGALYFSWEAIQFAISQGADVLSMSLGVDGIGGYWVERVVMENVLNCGVVAAVAAGNVGDDLNNYPKPYNVGSPGNCPSPWHNPDQTLSGGHAATVTVGATTSSDGHATFSSYGPVTWASGEYIGDYNDYPWESGNTTNVGLFKPDVVAPGSEIYSLDYSNNTGYSKKSGTSMATPCVAGVMALMLQVNPMLTPMEIDSIIETTAVHCGGQNSKSNTFGAGRIDALAAVNYMINACEAPTNLSATVNRADVNLSWTAASGVSTYRVYRNGVMIAKNVAGTTFVDEGVPAGADTYYVRGNGSNHQASLPSNRVTVTVTTNVEADAPTALDAIEINTNNNTVSLEWTAPELSAASIYYTDDATIYDGANSEVFVAAQRYPSSMLQTYAGMQIEHLYFSLYTAGAQCTVGLYEGSGIIPGTLLHEGTITTTEDQQMVDYVLPQPLVINPDKDLWLTVTTSDYVLENRNYVGDGTNNAFFFRYLSDNHWYSSSTEAWVFELELRDASYTYNVYLNGTAISTGQATTNYNGAYANGMNAYQVTAVTNGYESEISNTVMLVSNSTTENNLSLGENDKLFILPNSTLTVTGTLSNGNANNLIIEDGAQLIHNSANVQATVQKSIEAYTETGGWYTIATPFVSYDPALALASSDFDLYAYNEEGNAEGMEWINYKAGAFQLMAGSGYLYAHKPASSLSLAGTLNSGNYSQTVNLGYANEDNNIKGFNLLGNPTAHEITFSKSQEVSDGYYYLNNDESWNYTTSNSVPAGSGFLVKANATNQSVTINPQSKDNDQNVGEYLKVSVGGNHAYVKLNEGVSMPLLDLNRQHSGLYFTHEQKPYILLVRDNASSINLCYEPHLNGAQTLVADAKGLSLDYLHLIDNMTGADVDLLQNSSYTFESKVSDYASRFKLVFASESNDENSFAFNNNDTWFIYSQGEALLQVIDMTGHIVSSETFSGNIEKKISTAPGVYVLRLINGDNVKVQKIIIK